MSVQACVDSASRALRSVLANFATGVTVVTAHDASGDRFGSTVNAFTSVSLDPPLLLVCLRNESETLVALRQSRHFAVNVLPASLTELAGQFARSSEHLSWDSLDHTVGHHGPPVLVSGLATLECELHQIHDGGDHRIVVGKVLRATETGSSAAPLIFYRSTFVTLSQGLPVEIPAAPGP